MTPTRCVMAHLREQWLHNYYVAQVLNSSTKWSQRTKDRAHCYFLWLCLHFSQKFDCRFFNTDSDALSTEANLFVELEQQDTVIRTYSERLRTFLNEEIIKTSICGQCKEKWFVLTSRNWEAICPQLPHTTPTPSLKQVKDSFSHRNNNCMFPLCESGSWK